MERRRNKRGEREGDRSVTENVMKGK